MKSIKGKVKAIVTFFFSKIKVKKCTIKSKNSTMYKIKGAENYKTVVSKGKLTTEKI